MSQAHLVFFNMIPVKNKPFDQHVLQEHIALT